MNKSGLWKVRDTFQLATQLGPTPFQINKKNLHNPYVIKRTKTNPFKK